MSRRDYPKQLISLFGEHSLLQQTLLRCQRLALDARLLPPLIICNEAQRFAVAGQVAEINAPRQRLLLEPVGRNTAPALTVAALAQQEQGEDTLLLMLPADHVIADATALHPALNAAVQLAKDNFIVTFGIQPTRAHSGYGYLRRSQALPTSGAVGAFEVAEFIEKPQPEAAEQYLRSGDYLWNSGIFMVRTSVWLTVIARLEPAVYQACVAAYNDGEADADFFRLAAQPFMDCPDNSVDYAVMEKLSDTDFRAALIPPDAEWSDIGSWPAVWELGAKDRHNNVLSGDAIARHTTNSLIHANARLVCVLGGDNLAVIETADAVMVLNMERAQDMRQIVAGLDAGNRPELEQHLSVARRWGQYQIIARGAGYQAKRLTIRPGRSISLQLHHKRSEHWVVVKGRATVTRADEVFSLNVNESTYIPAGVKHKLENQTDADLEIIEVQAGEYLGEDDIVRFDVKL